jgi:hypothetical protein
MNAQQAQLGANQEQSRWSICRILFFGTFGGNIPAENRYIRRISIAMGLAACWAGLVVVMHFHPKRIILPVTLVIGSSVITYMVWEMRRYLMALDELARRMQFEAMAWTYLTGMVLAVWLATLAPLSHTLLYWDYRQTLLLLLPFAYMLLEFVRAGWLYILSRRY